MYIATINILHTLQSSHCKCKKKVYVTNHLFSCRVVLLQLKKPCTWFYDTITVIIKYMVQPVYHKLVYRRNANIHW